MIYDKLETVTKKTSIFASYVITNDGQVYTGAHSQEIVSDSKERVAQWLERVAQWPR